MSPPTPTASRSPLASTGSWCGRAKATTSICSTRQLDDRSRARRRCAGCRTCSAIRSRSRPSTGAPTQLRLRQPASASSTSPPSSQDVDIEDYARLYPFTYSSEDMPDLLRSIERQHLDPLRADRQLGAALRRHRRRRPTRWRMLTDMTRAIKREFTYVAAPEKGTQTPIETLDAAQGHLPRLCDADDRGGARARLRGAVRLGLRLQPDRAATIASAAATPMPGCASTCRARAGSSSIRPTASSAIAA